MKTNELEIGQQMTILNKYGDEIADGRVTDVERDGFTLNTGESVLFRQISDSGKNFVKLTVSH